MGGSSKGGGDVTVGYHYYMNIHFALCHGGTDELLEVRVGDRVAWRGDITGAGSALIAEPLLFGGEKREGGVVGIVDFMPGEDNQPVNPSLQRAITRQTEATAIPSYRGVTTAFFKGFDGVDLTNTPWEEAVKSEVGMGANDGDIPDNWLWKIGFELLSGASTLRGLGKSSFLWSAMNPYFKSPKFLIRRIWNEWYPEKARIGEDANPVHIIYECLTNKDWGLGYPAQEVDNTSFRQMADILYSEGMGLSLKWTTQTSVREFIEMVLEHINGTLVEDRESGQFRLILVRGGYDVDSLFELTEDNCTLDNFQRKTLSDTVNEVVVAFTRPEDGETDTVTVQDLANFSNTGKINSQKKEYPGARSPELAMRLALRDLNTLSKPVAKVTLICDRSIVGHYPGDVVKLTWPRLGLNGLTVRIGSMDLGTPGDSKVRVEAVEDVFALPTGAYATPQPIGWVDSAKDAEPVVNQKVFELSFYELQTSTTSADRLDWPEDVGFPAVVAQEPNSDSRTLGLYDDIINEEVGQGDFTESLTLTQDTGYLDATLHVDMTSFDPTVFLEGGIGWLGDELVEVTGFSAENETLTVNRALVDTVPAKHSVGERLWFYRRSDYVLDTTIRVADEVVDYKLIPETSRGKLPESQAPVFSYTLQNRQLRPYRPGNVGVNGQLLPETISADQDPIFSWSHRDRTQETTGAPMLFSAGNIGPEPGVTYTLEVIDEDGVSQVVETGLTGNSYEYITETVDLGKSELAPSGVFTTVGGTPITPAARRNTELRFKLKAVRDSLDSFQEHDLTVERAGYGYNYGRVS